MPEGTAAPIVPMPELRYFREHMPEPGYDVPFSMRAVRKYGRMGERKRAELSATLSVLQELSLEFAGILAATSRDGYVSGMDSACCLDRNRVTVRTCALSDLYYRRHGRIRGFGFRTRLGVDMSGGLWVDVKPTYYSSSIQRGVPLDERLLAGILPRFGSRKGERLVSTVRDLLADTMKG